MKFTTTYNTRYRPSIGDVPKSWIECKDCEDDNDYRCRIIDYFYDNIKHWDCDICGDEVHDFLFDSGKAYRLEYSWWSEWYNDNEEENGLKDEFFIEEIDVADAKVPTRKTRDWL